jgi:two-component system, sensor histidine kinase and response regulator
MSDPRPRLLIVDDDPSNLTLLRRLLEIHYDCTCVQSGQETLEVLKQVAVDVVLLDIMMPGMTGLQTLHIIRNTPATSTLSVILISALADSADIARGLELGANDYISKPIDVNVVPARIKTQLMLKSLLDERNQIIDDLRAAQQIRERFFRMATHDLKSPLTNIRLAHTLMRTIAASQPKVLEVLDTLDQSVDTMQEVIGEFLDSAALQSGKLDLRLETFAAVKLLNETVTQYQTTAKRKQISITNKGGKGYVHADYARMAQVLSNFMSNAIKYSPDGSAVTTWIEQRDGHTVIYVADQGRGIPLAERDRIFQEFGRTSVQPTAGESSTGLGLWIVKHLVTLHGGEVGFECPAEGGSIFWAALPSAQG